MRDHIATGVLVKTDCWSGYKGIEKEFPNLEREKSGKKVENFNLMHRVIMMFKVWLRGTHYSVMNLQHYINEYTYRFNRQKMKEGIFENLIVRMLRQTPFPYKEFIKYLISIFYYYQRFLYILIMSESSDFYFYLCQGNRSLSIHML